MEQIDYNPNTGELFWNEKAQPKVRNKPAIAKDGQGYIHLKVNGKMILGHRIAWFKHYGVMPDQQIDHINGIKDDNRIENLRLATNSQNSMNKPKQSNNTSGFKGVSFHKATNKFDARICVGGDRKLLGYFDTAEQAHLAYKKAQGELHEKFARI
jgi:hypothetical protein